MIIGDISLKRVPELMGFHCIHCSQHSLKAPKTKLFYHSTDIVCRKSKPDPDAVLLWKCSSSDSSGLIVHHDFHGFCFVGSKAQCNHMRPLIFYPFGETFIVDKALLSVFVRQFTVKVKFSWTVSSDLCCWLWHLARNTSSDEHDVLIFVPSSLVLILSRLSNASVIDAPINELSNRTQPWPCVRAWQCHHLSSRLRRNSFSNVLARLHSMMRP